MTSVKRPETIHPHPLGVVGYSNSGKTTLITRLISELATRHQVGYLKHDAHHFEMDQPGKDTWRASQSGAHRVVIGNSEAQASLANGPLTLRQQQTAFEECDLLLIEGWKQAPWPKLVMLDQAGEILKPLLQGDLSEVLALVGSAPQALPPELDLPWFHRADIPGILKLITGHFQAQVAPLYGLVLAGGHSLRMGQDKALLDYHGKAQFAVTAEILQTVCEQVFVSVRPGQQLPAGDSLALEDQFLGFGPVGGILSAMLSQPQAAWLVLACDLPFLDQQTLLQLCQERHPLKHATSFVSPHDGLPEPLCAIYEPPMRQRLLTQLGQGRTCPRKALLQARIHLLQAANPAALTNANTPADLQTIRQSLTQALQVNP